MVALLAGLSYLVARQITKPLESIRNTAERIASGDFKAEVDENLLNRRDEIGSLSRTAAQMGNAIDEALQAHKRLLSDVSHELRSPLTRLSLANTLMTKRLGEHSENNRIAQEVEELNGMIEQLLSLSRMQLMPQKERLVYDLQPVLQRCIDNARFSFAGVIIQFHDHTGSKIPHWVKGSDDLLSRAISNVLTNASRYCNERIELSLTDAGELWQLEIYDDGSGVPESELDKLFVPFYRPEFARQREKGGTGLGLAIVEQAILFHGGHVKAQPSDLGGLAIVMTIPKAEPTEPL